jgi:hypothetical protein
MNSKNAWSAGEDAALVALRSSGLGWTEIANELNIQRSAKICINRWVYALDPSINRGAGIPQDKCTMKFTSWKKTP